MIIGLKDESSEVRQKKEPKGVLALQLAGETQNGVAIHSDHACQSHSMAAASAVVTLEKETSLNDQLQ